jgi:hypothetical protein
MTMEASAAVKDKTTTIGIPQWTTSVLDSGRIGAGARRRRGAACLLLVLGCTTGCACSGVEPGPAPSPDATAVSDPVEPAPQEASAVSPTNVPQAMLDAALDDAAKRASVDRAQVKVVSAGAVTWSDGSAGCPAPGMMYTQALVPGYRIVLEAGGQTLNYHAGRMGKPTFCPAERVIPPSSAGDQAI